jgi:hypothetical protein
MMADRKSPQNEWTWTPADDPGTPALDQRIFGGLERPLGGLMCSGFLLLVA